MSIDSQQRNPITQQTHGRDGSYATSHKDGNTSVLIGGPHYVTVGTHSDGSTYATLTFSSERELRDLADVLARHFVTLDESEDTSEVTP